MTDGDSPRERDLAAGEFASWLIEVRSAIRGERGSDVPCSGCTACCTSSQFVHIGPEETDTLSHIPAELLFPAPGPPGGHLLLGYDERGHCPMLIDNRCSIYAHRPRTCRTYDCRVFTAAGVEIDGDDKVLIADRVRRWQFSFPAESDHNQHDAVRAAATYLDEHRGLLPDGAVPTNSTALAVLAVEIHEVFLHRDEQSGRTTVVERPDPDVVRREVMSRNGSRAGS